MADVTKINGYNIKDATARDDIAKFKSGDEAVKRADNAANAHQASSADVATNYFTGTSNVNINAKFNEVESAVSTAQNKADSAFTQAGVANSTANEAKSIAEGRAKAATFATADEMIAAVKAAAKTAYKVGDNIFIKETDVPDFWVSSVLDTNTGETGYFELSPLETQKVDLKDYATKTEVQTAQNTANSAKSTADKAASDIEKIEGGTITVGKAATAIGYDITGGGIKTKFDSVDSAVAIAKGAADTASSAATTAQGAANTANAEIDKIKNGTTEVGNALRANTAVNYDTSNGSIKMKFDSVDNAVAGAQDKANNAYTIANSANAKDVRFSYNAGTEELTISFS